MSLIDDFIQGFVSNFERLAAPFVILNEFFQGVDEEGQQPEDRIGQKLEESQPADEVAAAVVDVVEETILADLQEAGEITPENAEELADQVEGGATAVLFGLGLSGSAVEAASVGQVDQQQEYITQALAGLGVEDVTGTELDARLQEGVLPALEAKAAKDHRAKFVSLQDAVEFALRNKEGDDGYLTPENAPERVQQAIGSDDPVNPDNLVEEWGIRDDNLQILEEVALEAMEFEELIETPAELGLVVDEEVLDLVLDLAGYPEPLKDFLRQVPQEIPNSNRIWEERTAVEPLVQELERLATDEELTPAEAVDLIPDEVEDAKPALERRFANLQDVPSGPPTRSLVEGSFASGYTDLDTLTARLDRLEYDVERYDDVVRKTVLDELDGDLQEAVALGLVSPGQYSDLAEFAGLDDEAVNRLLQGQSISDITTQRLQDQADPATQPVGTLVGIGESRARALDAAGVETVADMAQADPETVAEAAQVSPETAQGFITQAAQRLG